MVRPAAHGRLFVGTSGFAYGDWVPRFYPPGTRATEMLGRYAERLPAVELNNTFYRQPTPGAVAAWLSATSAEFRFTVKAQRGGSFRAFAGGSAGSAGAVETLAWLTAPYRLFGDRLGSVLLRVPDTVARDDGRLAGFLAAWPHDMPLAMELEHPSWHADEVFRLLAEHGAALCATDLDEGPEPDLRLTAGFAYLRLRRSIYADDELVRWADRLQPVLASGYDCYVFFRHDADGTSALRALGLRRALAG